MGFNSGFKKLTATIAIFVLYSMTTVTLFIIFMITILNQLKVI